MATTPGLVRAFLEEPHTYFLLGIVLAFLWQTFSVELAGVYFILLVSGGFAWANLKTKLNFNSVSGNTPNAILLAVVAFIAFIAISFLAINVLQSAAELEGQSLQERIGATVIGAAQDPILKESKLAVFLIGALLIPIIETKVLIARLMEVLARIFHVSLNLGDFKTWVLFAVVAGVGVVFHFQAKGITDGIALMLTFIFWMISSWLIVKTRESESAVYLHIINNGWVLSTVLL